MTEAVVDSLEAVQIDERHHEALLVAPRLRNGQMQAADQQTGGVDRSARHWLPSVASNAFSQDMTCIYAVGLVTKTLPRLSGMGRTESHTFLTTTLATTRIQI